MSIIFQKKSVFDSNATSPDGTQLTPTIGTGWGLSVGQGSRVALKFLALGGLRPWDRPNLDVSASARVAATRVVNAWPRYESNNFFTVANTWICQEIMTITDAVCNVCNVIYFYKTNVR